MPDLASTFRELVSGKRRGLGASLARGALRIAEVPYSFVVGRRNRQFDAGNRPVERVAVPVISVGNITLGGTGKTPMVEWVCRFLGDRGARVAIVSRGYGKRDGAANDEALELAQKLPDVPHVQNPDRVAAATAAIKKHKCQAIVLDDAFQHRRIARDLDIVLLDSQEPFGFDHVFPRGTLREPLGGLARADCIALSRADMLVPENRNRIRQRALGLAPRALWAECVHKPNALVTASGSELPLNTMRGHRVAAFCGIGNPAGFRHTLASCGYEVSLFQEFADHHAYPRTDVASLTDWADQAEVAAVICTHKDLVKLGLDQLGDKPLYALRVGLEFLIGQPELEAKLTEVLSPPSRGDAEKGNT
jgi:tetraacyldisaccharide 4'-kinase